MMQIMLDKNFKDIISNIKEEIIDTQIKTMQEVNGNLIMLYFKLGKIVSENKHMEIILQSKCHQNLN